MKELSREQVVERVRKRIEEDPELEEKIKKAPAEEVAKLAGEEARKLWEEALEKGMPVYTLDTWLYRLVVIALGLTVVIAVIGGIIIGARAGDPPDVLVALGSAAVGALAGLFAPAVPSQGSSAPGEK